jgi:SMC interacting uncharacterized protein involved in chromosome segregation
VKWVEISENELEKIRAAFISLDKLVATQESRITRLENTQAVSSIELSDLSKEWLKFRLQLEQVIALANEQKGLAGQLSKLIFQFDGMRDDLEHQRSDSRERAKESRLMMNQIRVGLLLAAIAFGTSQVLPYLQYNRPVAPSKVSYAQS